MKKKNAVSDFASHRRSFLWNEFRRSLAAQSRIELNRTFNDAASAPAPRFWVSENRAAHVVGQHLLGRRPLDSMFPEKRKMYAEILRRFFILRKQRPLETISALVSEIVNSPAPSSYLSPDRVESIISAEKRLRRSPLSKNPKDLNDPNDPKNPKNP